MPSEQPAATIATENSTGAAAPRRARWFGWRLALAAVLLPFLAIEIFARTALFNYVSYTNSRSLDSSWKALNARQDWSVLLVGDSEVRWGFDPDALDGAMKAGGVNTKSFNLAIDGFSSHLSAAVLRFLNIKQRMPDLKVAVIGTQLIEAHGPEPITGHGDFDCEGAFQLPVLTSPLAMDTGLASLCYELDWKRRLVGAAESVSAAIRHRGALRSLLVGWSEKAGGVISFNSLSYEHRANGFQPHMAIKDARQNFEREWAGRQKEVAETPTMRAPLDQAIWPRLVESGGYFDRWSEFFLSRGVLPVFVALPTNPLLIDVQKRRDDYARNSKLLKDWQRRRGDVVFIDLGIQDDYPLEANFADFRHLSMHGAEQFSRELGAALAAQPLVKAVLARH